MATEEKPAKRSQEAKEFTFLWTGKNKSGKIVRGELRAPSEAVVNATLRRQGIDPENAICVTVSGHSMEPVLPSGSTVGVDQGRKDIKDGDIYALRHNDHLRVKMLYRLPAGGIRMRSFNRDEHPDEDYSFQIVASADEVAPLISKSEVDIAAVPANLASVLYNNTEGGVQVLAEGVETPEQLEFLRERGCDAYQGYLYSRPLSAADFTALLEREQAQQGSAQQRLPQA